MTTIRRSTARTRTVRLAALALVAALAACAEAPTGPASLSATAPSRDEVTCRNGFHIATRADGSTYCAPDSDEPTQ